MTDYEEQWFPEHVKFNGNNIPWFDTDDADCLPRTGGLLDPHGLEHDRQYKRMDIQGKLIEDLQLQILDLKRDIEELKEYCESRIAYLWPQVDTDE